MADLWDTSIGTGSSICNSTFNFDDADDREYNVPNLSGAFDANMEQDSSCHSALHMMNTEQNIRNSNSQEPESAMPISLWNTHSTFESDNLISDLDYLNPIRLTQVDPCVAELQHHHSVSSYTELPSMSDLTIFSATRNDNTAALHTEVPVQDQCYVSSSDIPSKRFAYASDQQVAYKENTIPLTPTENEYQNKTGSLINATNLLCTETTLSPKTFCPSTKKSVADKCDSTSASKLESRDTKIQIKKMSMNSILRYVYHHAPDFHISWCQYVATKLNRRYKTATRCRQQLINNRVYASFSNTFDDMSSEELQFAQDLVNRIRKEEICKDVINKTYGKDNSMYDFGVLGKKLTAKEQKNILMLLLRKISPKYKLWDQKIADFIGMKNANQVDYYRKKVHRKNEANILEDVTDIEQEISNSMCDLIIKWQDCYVNLYDAKNSKNLQNLNRIIDTYMKTNFNPSSHQILLWSQRYNVPPYVCFRTINTIKARFYRQKDRTIYQPKNVVNQSMENSTAFPTSMVKNSTIDVHNSLHLPSNISVSQNKDSTPRVAVGQSQNNSGNRRNKQSETKDGCMKGVKSSSIKNDTNKNSNPDDIITNLTSRYRDKYLRKLYADNPWPASLDKCMRRVLRHRSTKMARIMSSLRNHKDSGINIDPGDFINPEKYEAVKLFVDLKVKQWLNVPNSDNQKSKTPTFEANSTTSTINNENGDHSSPVLSKKQTTMNLPMENVYVKPDPELYKLNMNSVLRYVYHHIPDFHISWCKYIATTLGQNYMTAERLRLNMIKNPEIAISRFRTDKLSPEELSFADALVQKIENEKVSTYATLYFSGINDPEYDFGSLGEELSENEQRNVLVLLLRKALPFAPVWDKKISTYIGMEWSLVAYYRRRAHQGKIDYNSYLVDVTEKEEKISTHMAAIIKHWRDHNGQICQSKYDPNLDKLKSAMREHLKSQRSIGNPQILSWADTFRIPIPICYKTLKSLRSSLYKAKRKEQKDQT